MKIAGIILAAGLSRRMGQVKSLLPLGGSYLLQRVINKVCASQLAEVVVVLGHKAERIAGAIDCKDAKLVFNPDYSTGQSSSLKAGIAAVSADCDAVMFLLGDQPFVAVETINDLVAAAAEYPDAVIIPTFCGRRGNPVVAPRALLPMIAGITGDTGIRVLFQSLRGRIKELEVGDSGIHIDMDTAEEYRQAVELLRNGRRE